MKKLSFAAPFGLLLGLGLIIIAMWEAAHGNLMMFINIPSFLIIVGGTVASLIASFPMDSLKNLPSVIKVAFKNNDKYANLSKDIELIMEFAHLVRREGLLAMENNIERCADDPFLAKGISLLVDGADDETFELFLQTEMIQAKQRHAIGCEMVGFIASTAPSLGLVGTYAGLIPMLNHLDDPSTLGPLMALELCSSFYGGIIAYLVFAPIAKRLKSIAEAENARNRLLLEGLINIRSGINPQFIQENLLSFVSKINLNKNSKKSKKKASSNISNEEKSVSGA